jgi:uncharacterized membrane protein
MSDAVRSQESFRGTAILAYILLLVGWPSLHLTTVAALILAYVQRNDARGTVWESHFSNIIEVFWLSLVAGIAGILLIPALGLGFVVLVFLVVWFLYRSIKGLVRAVDGRPYF